MVIVPAGHARKGRDMVGKGRCSAAADGGLHDIGGQQSAGVRVGQLNLPVGEVGGVVGPDDVEALGGVDGLAGGGLEDVDSLFNQLSSSSNFFFIRFSSCGSFV